MRSRKKTFHTLLSRTKSVPDIDDHRDHSFNNRIFHYVFQEFETGFCSRSGSAEIYAFNAFFQ